VIFVGLILDAHAVKLMPTGKCKNLDGGRIPELQQTNGTNLIIRQSARFPYHTLLHDTWFDVNKSCDALFAHNRIDLLRVYGAFLEHDSVLSAAQHHVNVRIFGSMGSLYLLINFICIEAPLFF
jgi:hypothetical protein